MSATMQALVYTAPNRMELQAAPVPEPRPDEVLVCVAAVGICGSDMHAYHGHDNRRPAPLVLGHEAAGTIVSAVRAGQRVTINPLVVDPDCPVARGGGVIVHVGLLPGEAGFDIRASRCRKSP